ncbi:hypothetical protein [Sporosarcina sp.]|uniref:hypothetical protein n=1 Tax=Sporosarcina sp. TaxID=49982 RepID=UPI0026379156|nr:hypothetical protein [Sporosarcina sp.]
MRNDHVDEPNDHTAGVYERRRPGYERLNFYYDHSKSFSGMLAASRRLPSGKSDIDPHKHESQAENQIEKD